jgi:hypothetical protein
VVILLCGPNALTRAVTEGILDRKEEINNSLLGRSVIKIAGQKTELIKKGILRNATRDQFGEVHSIASMVMDIKKVSQESYEKTLTQIRNLATHSYKTTNRNKEEKYLNHNNNMKENETGRLGGLY